MPDDRARLAAEAYLYGFPLVFNLQQVGRVTREGFGNLPAAPFNHWAHATQLAGPEDTFVSVNNDTVYSIAALDAGGGPIRLRVPDSAGRYYVLQLVDAWTNNFAYVGHRATGTRAGTFLLVPPGWEGDSDDPVIHLPTEVAMIVGRWAVDGEHDLPPVAALQSELVLEPSGVVAGLPEPARVPEALRFFEALRTWLQAFPPAERDVAHQDRFAPLGLLETESPYADADPELAAALRDGAADGREQLEAAVAHGGVEPVNGWQPMYHAFDYNLDFFEVGASDDPAWQAAGGERERYVRRAVAARAGLWGNHGYEAGYAPVYVDADGEPLDGTRRYALRFDTPPPVGAFWSVTMYDVPEFYLVANPVGRYSIGDRTPGLVTAEDGSLTIAIQHEEPGDPAARANWLPAPAAPFRPMLRMYEPDAAVFDGGYTLPPITRID